jgi:hypothetical protein
MSCQQCGAEHTSLFCPPTKRATRKMHDPATCDHPLPWEQIGRCVYCAACTDRLYQGIAAKSEADRIATLTFLRKLRA